MTAGNPPSDRQHLNEDWIRTRRWDIRYGNGNPVTTLDGLAEVLGIDRHEAAHRILTQPFGKAAPQELLDEARQEPGGDPAS
ncbi:hypothetical protein OH807_30465 [Kitasatospora sp. NBC_01560]|uniref:hypothetical protein n=1 Tax=Kitasatospora sp. NBC_01560 TaxID=2975965 RepID=UPI00386D2148